MKCYGVMRFIHDPDTLISVGDTVKNAFKLSYNYKRYDNDGHCIKEPQILDFECWDSAAKFIAKNCFIGDKIYVEATPKQEVWEKDGQHRSKIVFRIDNFKVFN